MSESKYIAEITLETPVSSEVRAVKKELNVLKTEFARHREQLLKSSVLAELYTGVPAWLNDCVESADKTYRPEWLMEGYTSPQEKYAATPPVTHFGKVLSDGSISQSQDIVYCDVFPGEMTIVLNSGYYISGILKRNAESEVVMYSDFIVDCSKCIEYKEHTLCAEYDSCTKVCKGVYYAVAGFNYQLNIARRDGQNISEDELKNIIIRAYSKI